MLLSDVGPDFVTDPHMLKIACHDEPEVLFDDWTAPDPRAIAAELGRLPEFALLHQEYKDGSHGCGWASFDEIRLARQGEESELRHGYRVTRYVSVSLCRIAPLAAIMKIRERGEAIDGKGAYSSLPTVDDITDSIPWDERGHAAATLAKYGYRILSPEVGRQTMSDGLAADTLLGGRAEKDPYVGHTIFDGWFHWMD